MDAGLVGAFLVGALLVGAFAAGGAFLVGAARQLVAELHDLRDLVRRERPCAVRPDILLAQCRAGRSYDESLRRLTPVAVRDTDHDRVLDASIPRRTSWTSDG